MASTKLLIETIFGKIVKDVENSVDVDLIKDFYLDNQAIDLNLGNLIYWDKRYIQLSLGKVDDILKSSPRYMHAKKEVFERNAKKEYIPLLRTLLWRGILKKKRKYNPSLESIIRKEEGDFSKSEYKDAKEFVMNLLQRKGFKRSESAVREWLEGGTYTPLDWRILGALAKIHKGFREFDETNLDIDGKYYNYELFVRTRKEVTSYLARMKGIKIRIPYKETCCEEPERFSIRQFFARVIQPVMKYFARIRGIETKRDKQKRLKIRLDNEIGIVLRSLFGDDNKDYALSKILSIEKLPSKHPLNKEVRRNPEHPLLKGTATREMYSDKRRKGIEEFLDDYFCVNSLFSGLLNRYIDSRYKKEFEQFSIRDEKGNLKGYSEGLKHLLLYKYNEPEGYKSSVAFVRMQDLLNFDNERIEYADKITELLLNDMFKGRLDEYFGIPQDSFKKLIEAEYKLRVARPRIFSEQEQALDQYENRIKNINDFVGKGHSEHSPEYMGLINRAKETHDVLMRIEKRIEERFPLKCSKEFHGSIMLAYLKGSEKEEKPIDVERIIRDYDLEEFRDITKNF